MVTITLYWNKVVKDPTEPFGNRVLPEYDVKSQTRIDGTLKDLKKRWKNHPRMTIEPDRIVEDFGKQYGIHSYQVITEDR